MPRTLENVSKCIETLEQGIETIAKISGVPMEADMHALIAQLEPGMKKMLSEMNNELEEIVAPKTPEEKE